MEPTPVVKSPPVDGLGNENIWIEIQLKTFTNWINEQLKSTNLVIHDLQQDFANGLKLIALVECLQKRPLKKIRSPINQHQYIENVQIALNAISSDNIKLVNIGSVDIVSGNLKLILGLLWQLITRYQLGKATTPPKKLMLSWLEAALPDFNITNFTTDWNSGIALSALIEFCKPGLFPNWRKLNAKFSAQNCHKAMTAAFEEFNIPMIITPEDLSNPNLDEKSAITYLSYFMREDGPGYKLIMQWLRKILPDSEINNLTTDWNSGVNFCQILLKLGAHIPGGSKLSADKKYWEHNVLLAINAGKSLSVEPPNQLKAKHFTDPNIEHISVMAFLTKLMQLGECKRDKLRLIGLNLNNVFVNKEAAFNIEMLCDDIELECIRTEVHGPTNKLITSEITVNKFGGHGKFTPNEPGIHDLKVFYKEALAARPMKIKVHPDLSNVIFSGIEPCSVGSLVEVVINSNGAGSSDVNVIALSSTNRELECKLSEKDNSLIANFVPDEIGEWRIAITYSGEHINGSPFPCLVYDSSQVFVHLVERVSPHEDALFSIDTRQAGWGELSVKVEFCKTGALLPIKVDERGDGIYNISFLPELTGKYLVFVSFNQQNVKGSPYVFYVENNTDEIADYGSPFAGIDRCKLESATNEQNGTKSLRIFGDGLRFAQINRMAFFELNGILNFKQVQIAIKAFSYRDVPYRISKKSESAFVVEFKPTNIGAHLIHVTIDQTPIAGSPFKCFAFDLNKVRIRHPKEGICIYQKVQYEVDLSDAGTGDIQVLVNNGSVPCEIKSLDSARLIASFVPKFASVYMVEIQINGESVPNSPFAYDVFPLPKAPAEKMTFHIETLDHFEVNRANSFEIHFNGGDHVQLRKDELCVSIVDTINQTAVPNRIVEESANFYRVYFNVPAAGNYLFKVFARSSPGPIQTFTAKAYDISKIIISDIPKRIVLEQKCCFQVDASNAGEGQLEIAVNDGEVPNQVQVLGNGKCSISFIPELVIPHIVDIKFNNENVIGCPFICDVDEFPELKFDWSQFELVQVGLPLCFKISSNILLDKQLFQAKLFSPSNKLVPMNICYGKAITCEFMPIEVGPHLMSLEYCSKLVTDKPLTMKSFDPNKVSIIPAVNGYLNKMVQFIVDATHAGEGNLEISVLTNEKNVPTQVQPMGGAKFGVSFTPTQANDHLVSITFNNIAVNDNPFIVNILPSTDKPIITGPALYFSPVDQPAKLTIHNVDSENDIIAKVQDGNNQVVSVNIIKDIQNRCINLDFLPKLSGEYKVQIKYKNEHIQKSPFSTKIYDIRKIKVKDVPSEICLGKPVTFLVEATNAGPGNLEVIVNNGKVPSTPKSLGPSLYAITFVPTEPEIHMIEIKFNGKNVENSPFRCNILDTEKVMIKRLEKVPVDKVAQFFVDTNGGLLSESSIIILGPSHQNLKPILLGDHLNGYQIQFNPTEVGDHAIDVKIGGNSIPGCPFLVKVFDAKMVKVTDVEDGVVQRSIYFTIDASMAGAGNLEIIVSSNGRNVPNYVQSEGNARFRVNFKPTEANLHNISCKFNGEPVPGSPFIVKITEEDGSSDLLISESTLKNISLNKGGDFRVENPNNVSQQCQIMITTPSGKKANPTIVRLSDHFKVNFMPFEVGPHQVVVLQNDGIPVPGCPFTCNVYDVNRIKVSGLSNCVIGKPFTFLVDASQAGEGTLELVVATKTASVRAEVLMRSRGLYDVTFCPQECITHFLSMTFNEEDVPNSPFEIAVSDVPSLSPPDGSKQNLFGIVDQNNIVNFESTLLKNPSSNITGPNSSKITGSIQQIDECHYKLEYFPKEVGKHTIEILEHGKPIWNKPMYVEVCAPDRVLVSSANSCSLGKECEIKVDTSKAGCGELKARVIADKNEVPFLLKEFTSKVHTLKFTPMSDALHEVNLYYNNHLVPGSPFTIAVQTHLESIIIYGEGLKSACPNEKTVFFIETDEISANEFDIIVREPNRAPLPVKCYQQKNGCLLVEWIPKKIGSHKIEVFHGDKAVIGSPFNCEVFDASKVKIEPIELTNFVINKKINLLLTRKNAGYAELDVTVTSPLGRHLPIEVNGMPNGEGELIEFVPTVPGKYKIAITYGGVEIPDSPITFAAQESILPKVSGNGLYRGIFNEPCTFVVDAKDIYGSPEIKIDGPESDTSFSIEKCNDLYKITYIPLEIGVFDVKIIWNGQEIPNSPFHPHIVCLDKVRLIGGWEHVLDNEHRLPICLGEEKRLTFDISEAGPGKLAAKVKHSNSFEELQFEQTGPYKFKLTFKPKSCGELELYLYFEGILLPRMPVHMVVSENNSDGATVVLRGHGLAGARIGEESEIIIDGKDAGDGEPEVSLTGVKSDIKVKLSALGPRLYKAIYTPRLPGTYLFNVHWNQKQVKGCPLKISILPSCDAKRVLCTGDGLKGGTIGKEIKAFIDTRRAGPGELSAHCVGPNKAAICELYDQNDGTFTLLLHPQEGGKHTLNIKYGGQHVVGSPFPLKVYSAPDASKVKVIGPGIEHGVLPIYQSHFVCDTRGAGAGQLTVRIRGPKGAFRVEMQRESQKDRTIFCKYDPTEPGDYRIEVKWAGENVPGSPFFVMIFDTQDELNRYLHNGYASPLVSLPPLNAIEKMNGPSYSEDWKQMSWKGSTAEL